MALRALQGPAGGSAPVGGSGTTDTIPRWTGATTLGDSGLIDDGTQISAATRFFSIGTANLRGSRLSVEQTGTTNKMATFSNAVDADFEIRSKAAGILTIGTGTGTLAIQAGGAEAIRVLTSGNVGIGTASPAQTLDIRNTAPYQLRVGSSPGFSYDIGRSTTDGLLYFYGNQTGANGVVFGGINGERARIDSAGRWLVGTSTAASITSVRSIIASAGDTYLQFADTALSRGGLVGTLSGGIGLFTYTGAIGSETYALRALAGTSSLDISQTAGYGLKLPATNGTTYNTDPNTLDCYAEKDLTATMTCGTSGTITLSSSTLKFTRIGRVVTIVGRLVIGSVASPVGRLAINTGVGANEYPGTYAAAAVFPNGWQAGFTGAPSAIAIPVSAVVYLDRFTTGGVAIDVASYAQAGAEVSISLTYTL